MCWLHRLWDVWVHWSMLWTHHLIIEYTTVYVAEWTTTQTRTPGEAQSLTSQHRKWHIHREGSLKNCVNSSERVVVDATRKTWQFLRRGCRSWCRRVIHSRSVQKDVDICGCLRTATRYQLSVISCQDADNAVREGINTVMSAAAQKHRRSHLPARHPRLGAMRRIVYRESWRNLFTNKERLAKRIVDGRFTQFVPTTMRTNTAVQLILHWTFWLRAPKVDAIVLSCETSFCTKYDYDLLRASYR